MEEQFARFPHISEQIFEKFKKLNLKSSKQSIMSNMDEQFARFPHISEQIFDQLNNRSLAKCRRISKSWCNYLDNQKLLTIRIIKKNIRSSDCKDNFKLIIDVNKKPWTEFFKRASAESIEYFAKVSKNVLSDLSKTELQPFLMCGACTSSLSAYQSIFERLSTNPMYAKMMTMGGYEDMIGRFRFESDLDSDSDSDFENPDSAEEHQNIYAGVQNASRNRYLFCNLGCGATPLHLIAIAGHLETFKETYENAKDKNPNSTEKGRTFLQFAIRFCNKEICMYILEKTYDEIRKHVNGLSTLDMATLNANLDVCEIIFGRIVEKDPGSRQVTPLQLSSIQGHLETSEMILDKVVNKYPKRRNGELIDVLQMF